MRVGVVGLLSWVMMASATRADLVLDISDLQVAAGSQGTFDVTVRADQNSVTLAAWDTELVVDSNSDLVNFLAVTPLSGSPFATAFVDLSATVAPGKLQVQAFADSAPLSLNPQDGVVAMYRVQYAVAPQAAEGTVIAINFSANQFTNFLDESFSPVNFLRSGGTLTITTSAVPEPAAWASLGVVALLAATAQRWKRRSVRRV